MFDRSDFDDLGKLVLRVTIGGLMLLHGIHKLRHGIGGIENVVEAKGLPGFVAYGVHVGETVAPLLIVAGFKTRIAALVMGFNMVVAILLRHADHLFALNERTGGWRVELAGLYLFGAAAIFLLGAGRFSVSRGRGRWD